ncbi:neutral/alkaline non-lysosomal ceramidase N-terminal domain-containing protein [Krasilnikoviella flava]|uniref:Neutral/alkaline non-lysosomal ceramidase, N-terminal n=1 Tax=Krasilnikoviella flava TaxID=526729 RepID=A0A1T5L4E3_9MICO|nr:neutral/alkaline non-lysosomal ceramidase N-terminal domain-containing protein [Krasilnikoviella flava]SKC70926.1 Neutral/alkaline non-lysosomal ceramidase, N-terminal [Krasilnikoviella flava]
MTGEPTRSPGPVPRLLVGAATVEVEVPPGTPMAGFAARQDPSRGVHDPTTVRALVLDDVALVSVDVCALHEDTCAQVRARLADVVPTCVVAATHTHSGPCVGRGRVGRHAAAVHDDVVAAAERAVRHAHAKRRACAVEYTEVRSPGVGANRRHPGRSVDLRLQALCFRDPADGRVVSRLVVYPCHPVVLDAANLLVSADYPGQVRTVLEAGDPGSVTMFLTGAAGDINTGHRAEDSYRASGTGLRTYAEAERVGAVLADALGGAARHLVGGEVQATAVTEEVDLPLLPVDREQVRRDLARWTTDLGEADADRAALLGVWASWARGVLDGGVPERATWRARVTAVRLGEVALVALPGEPFLASGEQVRAASSAPVIVLGYSDGCPGYLPPREEYAHGGYEVDDAHRYYDMPAPFAPGAAEQLVAVACRLVGADDGR